MALDTRIVDPADGSGEPLLMWALGDGTRCIAVVDGHTCELRIERNGVVLHRERNLDAVRAREVAREWCLNRERGTGSCIDGPAMMPCPECGSAAFFEGEPAAGICWLHCESCGEAWTVSEGEGHSWPMCGTRGAD